MRREPLSIESLSAWIKLNNVKLNGVNLTTLPEVGTAVVATCGLFEGNHILMTVPQELVISLDNVWVYAKADQNLLQILEAVGDYSRVPCTSLISNLNMRPRVRLHVPDSPRGYLDIPAPPDHP